MSMPKIIPRLTELNAYIHDLYRKFAPTREIASVPMRTDDSSVDGAMSAIYANLKELADLAPAETTVPSVAVLDDGILEIQTKLNALAEQVQGLTHSVLNIQDAQAQADLDNATQYSTLLANSTTTRDMVSSGNERVIEVIDNNSSGSFLGLATIVVIVVATYILYTRPF